MRQLRPRTARTPPAPRSWRPSRPLKRSPYPRSHPSGKWRDNVTGGRGWRVNSRWRIRQAAVDTCTGWDQNQIPTRAAFRRQKGCSPKPSAPEHSRPVHGRSARPPPDVSAELLAAVASADNPIRQSRFSASNGLAATRASATQAPLRRPAVWSAANLRTHDDGHPVFLAAATALAAYRKVRVSRALVGQRLLARIAPPSSAQPETRA
jgi:hypothetical protein